MKLKLDHDKEEKGGGDTLRSKSERFGNNPFDRSLPIFDSPINARIRKWAIPLLIIGAVTGATLVSAYSASVRIQSYGTIVYTEQSDRFDPNDDGRINIIDVAMVVKGLGSRFGDQRWNPGLDFNGDGRINEVDLSIIARNWRGN